MVNIREIAFLSKTKDDEWSRGKYFKNYFFLYMVRFKCVIASRNTNNSTIIIILVRSLLLRK